MRGLGSGGRWSWLRRTAGWLVAVLALTAGCGAPNGDVDTTPTPRFSRVQEGPAVGAGGLRLVLPADVEAEFDAALDSIRSRLYQLGGEGPVLTVRVEIGDAAASVDSAVQHALAHPEGYVLRMWEDSVRIDASTPTGSLRGLTTLEELALDRDGHLPVGMVADRPAHPIRALHFVLRDVSVEEARRLVGLARSNQFNMLIVQLADGVRLPSIEAVARSDAWSLDRLSDFAEYARSNGLQFVPELKLLSQQGKLLKGHYPELMYNSKTYDPRKERTYELVSRIIDDVLRVVDPDVLHIGHDEVAGVGPGEERKELSRDEEALPAGLFLQDVRRLNELLEARGVETWMWGDMLVGASEFPEMLDRHLHGIPSYTKLRGRLPEEIVISDWHYSDRQEAFPSLQAFLRSGHPVLGTTWRRESTTRNFSRYAASLGEPGGRGMIATTWWLVQRGEWEQVADVAQFSGDVFWNAGQRSGRRP